MKSEINKKQKIQIKRLKLLLPFIVLLIVYMIGNSNVNPLTGKPRLKVGIECEDNFIYIRNLNNYEWTDVHIYLNDKYLIVIPVLYSKDTIVTILKDFKTQDGIRFDLEKNKPETIYIEVTTPKGKGTIKRDLP